MNEKQLIQTSKFLSLVLRHNPEKIGLTLDPAGWVSVADLLTALKRHNRSISREELDDVVTNNNKKRFAYSEDRARIRASQGHSIDVSLGYTAQTPPEFLYHGTATRFLASIRTEGLCRGERHHVHLAIDSETALKVGQRHGKPVILIVHAGRMQSAGHDFYVSENGVWLVNAVPKNFIEFAGEGENQ